MKKLWLAPLAALVLLAGCHDEDHAPRDVIAPAAPRDVIAPAAPRGLTSVTGDGEVFLSWYANTEGDVAGYRIYESGCASGPGCPYDRVGTTNGTSFIVTGLTNGVTRYFAVAAYDRAGNESDLTYQDLQDTPRPEGFGRALTEYGAAPATAGYDFSAFAVRPWNDPATDVYFGLEGGVARMIAPFTDTDIQDAGYALTLDAVDYAPNAGWSPTGKVDLIRGHCYVVRILNGVGGANYAKFRVTSVGSGSVVFDWAYQTAVDNRELKSAPVRNEAPRVRRVVS